MDMKRATSKSHSASQSETKTLRRKIGNGFVVTVLVVAILYGSFVAYAMQVFQKNQEAFSQNVLENYANLLEKDTSTLINYVRSIASTNLYFENLIYPPKDEFDWVAQVNGLISSLQTKIASVDIPSAFFFMDPERRDGLLMSFSSDYSLKSTERQEVYAALLAYLSNTENGVCYDILYTTDCWLLFTYTVHGKSIGCLLNLSMYEREYVHFDLENQQLVLLDAHEQLLAFTPSDVITESVRTAAFERENTARNGYPTRVLRKELSAFPLQVVLVAQTGSYFDFSHNPLFLLFLIGAPLAIAILFLSLYGYLRRLILMPLEYLRHKVSLIRSSEALSSETVDCIEAPRSHKTKEFSQLESDLDEIVNEIVHLQEEKYKQERAANAAQLQYLHLQLNPHFFLNCLNVIYSLHRSGDDDTSQKFMSSMISHFRYVFNDKFSMVTLREELKEVRDYADLYTIKNGTPLLIRIHADEDCLDERLPILAVQTFVENSIKYAAKEHAILSIDIHASKVVDEACEYLCVQVFDNGNGYSDEWLKINNSFTAESFSYASAHVGISNLKYRMHLIYKGNARIAFRNRPGGGAAVDAFFPLNSEELL